MLGLGTERAKFDQVVVPLARRVMTDADTSRLSFEVFSLYILTHELMHGLGPQEVRGGEQVSTIRERLQETYSPIEEAKADAGGIFALRLLLDRGILDASLMKGLYSTYVASVMRALRFGLTEDHAKADAVQLMVLRARCAARHARRAPRGD